MGKNIRLTHFYFPYFGMFRARMFVLKHNCHCGSACEVVCGFTRKLAFSTVQIPIPYSCPVWQFLLLCNSLRLVIFHFQIVPPKCAHLVSIHAVYVLAPWVRLDTCLVSKHLRAMCAVSDLTISILVSAVHSVPKTTGLLVHYLLPLVSFLVSPNHYELYFYHVNSELCIR